MEGAVVVGRVLVREFLASVDVGVCEAEVAPGARDAALEVADQWQLLDAGARLEAVAVEEDVAGDGPAFGPQEGIEADALHVRAIRVDVVGASVQIDMRRAVVDAQVPSDPDHAAAGDIVVDIAD